MAYIASSLGQPNSPLPLRNRQPNPLLPQQNPQPHPLLPQQNNRQPHSLLPQQNRFRQDFEYFIVVDFEATCDKDRTLQPQEIIEFPSLIVSGATGQILHYFHTYVRPTCNPVLNDFCKELTGLKQDQVNNAMTLEKALLLHDNWLFRKGILNTKFAAVTWSNWDCEVMLESECRYKRIQKPSYFNQWINLRIPFSEVFGNVRCNLKEAVELAGLVWQGRVHRGLDDTINISKLLQVIMKKGFKFSITKSLMMPPQATLNSPTWTHHPFLEPHISGLEEEFRYCYCGARSVKKLIRKPGPKCGKFFFGCGNWTPNKGACCNYSEWAATP